MNELAWLVGYRFQSLTQREDDWVVAFDRNANIVINCLWRFVESGRIRFTSEDDGHPFGLPEPVDAAAKLNRRLAGASVEGVDLRERLLDLDLRFSTGHTLQVIPNSSGYEAWSVSRGNRHVIAVGGGELEIYGSDPGGG